MSNAHLIRWALLIVLSMIMLERLLFSIGYVAPPKWTGIAVRAFSPHLTAKKSWFFLLGYLIDGIVHDDTLQLICVLTFSGKVLKL